MRLSRRQVRAAPVTQSIGVGRNPSGLQLAGYGPAARNNGNGSAFGPSSYLNSYQPQFDQFDPKASIANAYLTEVYTFRCIQSISRAITGCAFLSGPDIGNKKTSRKSTPMARLFNRNQRGQPNPLWSSSMFLRYSLAQYVLTGKTAWNKVVNGNGQLELWPLMVQSLKPIPGKPNDDTYFVGYDYGVRGTANYRLFKPEEIVYMAQPSLADVRQPESVMQAVQLQVSVLRMLDLYNNNYLRNAATPATLITTPPFAVDDERQAFREQFTAEFSGFTNAGKSAFAEVEDADNPGSGAGNNLVSVQRIGATSVESEFRQLSEDLKDDITLAWGCPRSVLGDSSGKTFSNSGQDRRNWWLETLSPTSFEFADQINTFFAPTVGSDVGWFDTSAVPELQNDSLITGVNVVSLIANNVITRDEARTEMSLPPGADVDLPDFGPAPGQPVDVEPKSSPFVKELDPSAAPAAPTTAQPVEVPAVSVNGRSVTMIETARIRREARHAGPEGHEHIPSGHVTKGTVAAMLSAGLRKILAQQQDEANRRAAGKRGQRRAAQARSNPASLYDRDYWAAQVAAAIEPVFGRRSADLAMRAADDTSMALRASRGPDEASAILERAMAQFIDAMSDLEVDSA